MKKQETFYCSLYLIIFLFTLSIFFKYSAKNPKYDSAIAKTTSNSNIAKTIDNPKINTNNKEKEKYTSFKKETVNSKIISSNNRVRLSRGGTLPRNLPNKTSKSTTYSSNIRLLDWKVARNIFSRNSQAVVTDIYTKRSFNVKRTMGSNHADAETLTKKDTQIIKEIWGGFSWNRRPVIVHVNGQNLAASMSAMPHAGIDSAPAFRVVNNRSQGYGKGQNLDVIKNNGMDGHFDIHFLNSTRHMDGKKDPEHQAAVIKASRIK